MIGFDSAESSKGFHKTAGLWESLRRAYKPVGDEVVDKHLIKRNLLTKLTYSETCAEDEDIKRLQKDGEKVTTFPPLLEDLHALYYQHYAKVREPDSENLGLNHKFLTDTEGSVEFKRTKQYTAGDKELAQLAVQKMGDKVLALLEEQERKQKEREEKNKEREKEGKDPLPEPSDFALDQAISKAVSAASEETASEVEATANILRDFDDGEPSDKDGKSAGNQGAQRSKEDHKSRLDLAKQIAQNKMLMQVIDLAGKVHDGWVNKEFQQGEGFDEITDVTIGDNLQQMLPSCAAELLYNEWGFLARIAERKLDVVETKGKEQKERGSLILCGDVSGSMGGSDIIHQGAVMFAAIHRARKQGRTFGVMLFNQNIVYRKVFHNGRIGLKDAIDIISTGASGGTNFDNVLTTCIDMIKEGGDVGDADVIMISDDACRASDEVQKRFVVAKKSLGFHLYYMPLIAGGTGLDDIADEVVSLVDRDITKTGANLVHKVVK